MKKLAVFVISLIILGCACRTEVNLDHKYKAVYQNELDKTVHIVTVFKTEDGKMAKASGSGVYIKKEAGKKAVVLTAAHVVKEDNILEIAIYQCPIPYKNKNECSKKLVSILAINIEKDLALLETVNPESKNGLFAKLSNSYPKIGEKVLVVGSPAGKPHSIYDGLFASAMWTQSPISEADDPDLMLMYQISAPIFEGNSGGPIFNMKGELIGIVDMGLVQPILFADENGLYLLGIIPIPGMNYAVSLPEISLFLQQNLK